MKCNFFLSYLVILPLLSLAGCKQAPEEYATEDHFSSATPSAIDRPLSPTINPLQNLWFLFQESGETTLNQYSLTSKKWRYQILPFGSDAKIFPDSQSKNLFILQRMQRDALYLFNPQTQQIVHEYTLPEGINPQSVYRDPQGLVWLTCYETNDVMILSEDLSREVTRISLDSLKDDSDPSAELGHIAPLDKEARFMGVLAQRIQRGPLGRWIPALQGGIAVIDRQTKQVLHTYLLPLSNPHNFHFSPERQQVTVMGSGDLTLNFQSAGKVLVLNDKFYERSSLDENDIEQNISFSKQELLLDADWTAQDEWLALIWKPKKQKTCLQQGLKELFCEKDEMVGYVMGQMTIAQSSVYGNLSTGLNHFLWKYDLHTQTLTKMPLTHSFYSFTASE
jgi:hypothetical protein